MVFAATLSAVCSLGTLTLHAETVNPIFGSASVQATTTAQNKATVGKGAYADYYGYYGYLYGYYSYLYGTYGYGYKNYNYYYDAYVYADAARTFLSNAYIYQYYGY